MCGSLSGGMLRYGEIKWNGFKSISGLASRVRCTAIRTINLNKWSVRFFYQAETLHCGVGDAKFTVFCAIFRHVWVDLE